MPIVDKIIEYESGDMPPAEILAFFQELITGGLIHQLQGHYQRTARQLIEAGLIVL